jgi:hypothetical protein
LGYIGKASARAGPRWAAAVRAEWWSGCDVRRDAGCRKTDDRAALRIARIHTCQPASGPGSATSASARSATASSRASRCGNAR